MRYFPLIVAGWLLFCLAPACARAQKLECKPCSHNFGELQIGTSHSYSIEVSNTGTKGLTIQSALKQGALAFSLENLSLPMRIKAGDSVQLTIVFAPKNPGQKTGVFELVSTAENRSLKIDVSGIAEANTKANAQLKVSPATLNFGNVAVGSSASLRATLTASKGSVILFSDRSTSSEFEILGLKLPLTISAGKSIPVTIRFTPNGSGTDPAKVGFISNAADSPTLAEVTGAGVAKGSYSVYLSWDGDEKAVGYNVLRGTSKSGPFDEINTALDSSTNYTDSTVVAGNTYYYVTTAVNSEGRQSGYSNVTEAVIP